MYSVYKIQNVITKEIYIGITQSLETRWYAHKRSGFNSSRPLCKSISKYGISNFVFNTLEAGIKSKDEAKKKENYFIYIFNSLAPKGFNTKVNGGRMSLKKINEALGTDY